MVKMEGFIEVKARLRKLQRGQPDRVSVIVGYTANYALWVHECEMKHAGEPRRGRNGRKGKGRYWDPQGRGQNKFLETPARRLRGTLGKIVRAIVNKGGTLLQGLYMAGLRLQRDSQRMVPVDTGNLKASAFTREEK